MGLINGLILILIRLMSYGDLSPRLESMEDLSQQGCGHKRLQYLLQLLLLCHGCVEICPYIYIYVYIYLFIYLSIYLFIYL